MVPDIDKKLIYKLVFLAKTGFPLDCILKLREWCEIMDHFWVWPDLDDSMLEILCKVIM